MGRRQVAAAAALLLSAATLVFAGVVIVTHFPNGLPVLACTVLAVVAAWYGLVRRGAARAVGLGAAVLLLAAALVLLAVEGLAVENAIIIAGVLLSTAAARAAFSVHVGLPAAPRPSKPVLFMNPRSGDGKAEKFHLADEARARGIEAVELQLGDDLVDLVDDALARGADALAMAGGDGSQAIVAAIAAERGLPYACIPAGTRNHFALDLGVDREDVVGALDAFVDGSEHQVDLAEVNGRVFVNNVSLGLYAEAVQRQGYREAKIRTLLETVPDVVGPDASALDLQWEGPAGDEHRSGVAILVSNNRYRLGRGLGSGTRPRIDEGVLGIAAVDTPAGSRAGNGGRRQLMSEWSAPAFSVASGESVPAGIDGESVVLEAPLTFRSHPAALRARIARAHPGASPSAAIPDSAWGVVTALARMAVGRDSHLESNRGSR